MRDTRVVIIGAGPAGTMCGYLLKQAKIDCIIVDYANFPREKLCGGGLTPKAYTLLKELMPEVRYEYQAVSRAKFMMDGRVICEIDISKELRMVRRKDFDYQLLQQFLGVGGELINDTFDVFEQQANGTILVKLKSGEEISCDYLVGADGANSRVRKALFGKYSGNTLWMEQYTEKGENEFVFELSKDYHQGYYFVFPSVGRNVLGAGGTEFRIQDFKPLLDQKNIEQTKAHGAFIPIETVVSNHDRIILIGDAGGFANKISFEGLYYALATAQNAFQAIATGKRFKETNKAIFKKKNKETYLARIFFSDFGLWLVKIGAHSPKLIKKVFERYV